VGDGGSARGQWGGAAGRGLIGVFPTANLPDRETTWYSTEVEGFVIAILKELKRTYKIDTNRIYCAGHSLGGSGSWHIGLRHADVFAGVSPNAGGLRAVNTGDLVELPGGFIANLFNTPIFFTHYDKDPRVGVADARAAARELAALEKEHPGGYEHVYIEGKGVNHGFPPGGNAKKIINWLTKRKRDPYPKTGSWRRSRRTSSRSGGTRPGASPCCCRTRCSTRRSRSR
jgi:dienelactone hydrolase